MFEKGIVNLESAAKGIYDTKLPYGSCGGKWVEFHEIFRVVERWSFLQHTVLLYLAATTHYHESWWIVIMTKTYIIMISKPGQESLYSSINTSVYWLSHLNA